MASPSGDAGDDTDTSSSEALDFDDQETAQTEQMPPEEPAMPLKKAVAEAVMANMPEIGRILESQLVGKVAGSLGFATIDERLRDFIDEVVAKLVQDGQLEKNWDDVWRRSWRTCGLG